MFQVPDIGVCRRDAQRHVRVVGQFHLLHNNSVAFLLSLIGVCPQVSFVRCGEGGFAVLIVNVDQLFAFVISDRTFTGRVIDTHFVVTGCRSNVITRVIDFRLIASPGIAITVDGQVAIRVHRDHTVAVVRLSDVVSTIVSQIGIQHKAVAVNVEDTGIHVTVSIGVAGQIQGISLQRIRGAVAHIQNAVVGDVDGVCIQCGIVHAPASRHIISNRDGTVVDCQFISCNMTIFIDIQGRAAGQGDAVRNQIRVCHIHDGTAVDAQRINQRGFRGIPL